jgi:hypothetical protein
VEANSAPGSLRLNICDEETLDRAAGHCHDGVFDPEEAGFDSATSTFTLRLWRETEGRLVPRRIPFLKRRVDAWVRCCLVFREVQSADVHRRYTDPMRPLIEDINYDANTSTVALKAMGFYDATLRVARIRGELADTGEIASNPGGDDTSWRPAAHS